MFFHGFAEETALAAFAIAPNALAGFHGTIEGRQFLAAGTGQRIHGAGADQALIIRRFTAARSTFSQN